MKNGQHSKKWWSCCGRKNLSAVCESHRSSIVEYALRNIDKPISFRVTRELPAPIREEVPTVEDLQINSFPGLSSAELLRTCCGIDASFVVAAAEVHPRFPCRNVRTKLTK